MPRLPILPRGADPPWLLTRRYVEFCERFPRRSRLPATYWNLGREQTPWPGNYPGMGTTKAIRKQAVTAERVATQTANTFVADQMKNLAEAFRAQADVLKKKKKKRK